MILTGHSTNYDVEVESFNIPPSHDDEACLKRDNYTCLQCSFASRPHKLALGGFMQAIDSGGGLETHCAMCAASVTIGRKVMGRNDYGKLIYAPELSQKNVSDIVRITIATNLLPPDSIPKVIRQNSKTLFDGLMSEQYLLDGDVFPFFEGSYGNLEDLADICRYATPKVKDKYASLFKDIRFLPDIEAFKGPVQFWLKANPQFFQPLTQQQKAV